MPAEISAFFDIYQFAISAKNLVHHTRKILPRERILHILQVIFEVSCLLEHMHNLHNMFSKTTSYGIAHTMNVRESSTLPSWLWITHGFEGNWQVQHKCELKKNTSNTETMLLPHQSDLCDKELQFQQWSGSWTTLGVLTFLCVLLGVTLKWADPTGSV